jgi:hypothetical protein
LSLQFCVQHLIHTSLVAATIVLEYSFFLLQKGQQQPAKILELAASQYVESGTPSIIKGIVDELLHQHHSESHDLEYGGGDEMLCKMIIDIILQERMRGFSFGMLKVDFRLIDSFFPQL